MDFQGELKGEQCFHNPEKQKPRAVQVLCWQRTQVDCLRKTNSQRYLEEEAPITNTGRGLVEAQQQSCHISSWKAAAGWGAQVDFYVNPSRSFPFTYKQPASAGQKQ